MLVLFIAAIIPTAHTACALPPQGPGLSLHNAGCCLKTPSNPFSSQCCLSPRAQILAGDSCGLKTSLQKVFEGRKCCTTLPVTAL